MTETYPEPPYQGRPTYHSGPAAYGTAQQQAYEQQAYVNNAVTAATSYGGPNGQIFSDRTDRAIGLLAKVTAIYLIVGLVLGVLVLIGFLSMGSSLLYWFSAY